MPRESEYLHLSQSEHEEVSTGFLVRFRDAQKEKIANGHLDPNEPCGAQAKMIDELLFCFFDEQREAAGAKSPSSMITTLELADYVNDEILPLLAQYRPDLLSLDWQGLWQLCDSDISEFDMNSGGEGETVY